MLILLLFAFLSGLVTIFAPCIWPILPIILSSTTTGGHRKPLGITLGILLSFGTLLLLLSYVVKALPFDTTVLRFVSVGVVGLFGLSLLIPAISDKAEGLLSRFVGKVKVKKEKKDSGFLSGFLIGLPLGIIWSPCVGPLLATIATIAALQAVTASVILVTAVYLLGVGIPLLLFATLGSWLFTRSRVLSQYTRSIRQVFGIIMILTAIAIATNYDKVLQVKLLETFPSYVNFIYELEGNSDVQHQLQKLKL